MTVAAAPGSPAQVVMAGEPSRKLDLQVARWLWSTRGWRQPGPYLCRHALAGSWAAAFAGEQDIPLTTIGGRSGGKEASPAPMTAVGEKKTFVLVAAVAGSGRLRLVRNPATESKTGRPFS